jgi:hypothetical protein
MSKRPDPPRARDGPGLVICTGWSAGANNQLTDAALPAWFGARRYTDRQRKPRACRGSEKNV